MPLVEGLRLTHNALLGTGVRKHIKLIASGRVFSGMGIVRKIALGLLRQALHARIGAKPRHAYMPGCACASEPYALLCRT